MTSLKSGIFALLLSTCVYETDTPECLEGRVSDVQKTADKPFDPVSGSEPGYLP